MTKRSKKPRTDQASAYKKLSELARLQGYKLEKIRPGPKPVYNPEFHPADYIRQAAQGNTKAQICASWGIHRDTLHEWCNGKTHGTIHKEMADSLKKGDELRSSWWTGFATSIAAGKVPGGNATMTIFLMKNILPTDFKDRIDHGHTLDIQEMDFGE